MSASNPLSGLTREHKIYIAAGANVLFFIMLFLNWFGRSEGGFSVDASGQDVVPSWWILLITSLLAAGLLIAEVFNFELPGFINPAAWAAYLTSIGTFFTVAIFFEGGHGLDRKFGLWLALLFSIVAIVFAVIHWREER
ncbi:MAG: hypothetical protein AB7V42_09980 [Thermoleophilia bacterium]